MYYYTFNHDVVAVSANSVLIGRFSDWLLSQDMILYILMSGCILLVCWLIRFIIELKEDA
jgi:hypothetical protein